jgi:hypothetical protein
MLHIRKNTGHSVHIAGRRHFVDRLFFLLAIALLMPVALRALNPSEPPGSNFNLSVWSLQLPTGSTGDPTTISNTQLEDGFTDSYFFTNSNDGSMAFKDPGTNCVTTPNSTHCRTELSEVNSSGASASWSGANTNVLSATVVGNTVGGTVVIGQIHMVESYSTKPLIELYYDSNGTIQAGVEQTTAGGNEVLTTVGSVPIGTQFTYVINYSNNQLSVSINGKTTNLSIYSLGGIPCYFKAGDYGQTTNSTKVSFYALTISHTSGGGGGGGATISNGTYTLTPQCATALRLDDEGARTTTGNGIDVYTANGTGAQNWAASSTNVVPAGYYNFSTEGAYCLTASGTGSGSAVVLDPCAGSTGQAWEAVQSGSDYVFHPANNTGLCLDVKGASSTSGTGVDVYSCNGTNAQNWALTVN